MKRSMSGVGAMRAAQRGPVMGEADLVATMLPAQRHMAGDLGTTPTGAPVVLDVSSPTMPRGETRTAGANRDRKRDLRFAGILKRDHKPGDPQVTTTVSGLVNVILVPNQREAPPCSQVVVDTDASNAEGFYQCRVVLPSEMSTAAKLMRALRAMERTVYTALADVGSTDELVAQLTPLSDSSSSELNELARSLIQNIIDVAKMVAGGAGDGGDEETSVQEIVQKILQNKFKGDDKATLVYRICVEPLFKSLEMAVHEQSRVVGKTVMTTRAGARKTLVHLH